MVIIARDRLLAGESSVDSNTSADSAEIITEVRIKYTRAWRLF